MVNDELQDLPFTIHHLPLITYEQHREIQKNKSFRF